jgi:hypothetical protein
MTTFITALAYAARDCGKQKAFQLNFRSPTETI